jgi:hypothetical protein
VDKLTTSDKLILGGGIVFLIAMFLPWEGIDTPFGDFANNGWDYFLSGWLPLILIAIMAGHVAVTRFSPDTAIPDLPVPWSQGYLVAGVVSAVIVVLRLLIPAEESGVDLDRKFGLMLAAIAAICVAVGASMKLKEDEPGAATGGSDTGSAPF